MKRRMKKCVSAFLALMLLTTLLPAAGFAEDGQRASVSNSAQSPVQLTKSVQTDDKGDSTLSLEAYVTGNVTHSDTPLDIVMVMDQSGSMQGNNLTALKAAANTFMTTIAKDAGDNNVDHRVAVVGYASDEDAGKTGYDGDIINGSKSYWVNTGLYVNGDFKNYETKDSYQEISRDEMDNASVYYIYKTLGGYTEIHYRDGKWKYYGGWLSGWVEIDKNETVYKLVSGTKLSADDYKASLVSAGNSGAVNPVVSQTINKLAASGATYTEYGMLMAGEVFKNNPIASNQTRKRVVVLFTDGATNSDRNTVLEHSNALKKTYEADVFTVGLGVEGESDFLRYISSDYKDDTSYKNKKYSGTPSADGIDYSLNAKTAEGLKEAFEKIAQDVASVPADATTVLSDTMSDMFVPTTDASGVKVYTQTASGTGTEPSWGSLVDITDKVSVNLDGKTVKVSGFNYNENLVLKKNGTWQGKKLVVKFGIKPDTTYTDWQKGTHYYDTNNTTDKQAALRDKDGKVLGESLDKSPRLPVTGHSITYSWTNAPTGKNVPVDNKVYISGQDYTVDTTTVKTGDSVDVKDGYGNVTGTYTFQGWNTADGTMGDNDLTIKGSWKYDEQQVATHQVIYNWGTDNIPPDVNLPTDGNKYVKGQSYTVDTTYTDKTKIYEEDAYDNIIGVYTFSGWTDAGNGKMGDSDAMITGEWHYDAVKVAKHGITYEWSGDVPETVTLPTDSNTYVKGQPYEVDKTFTAGKTINVTDTYGNIIGTYTFSGWTDPNNGVMGDSDITITGTWTYKGQTIPTHKITYDWGNENIPAGETLPVDENTYVKNQPYEVDKTFAAGKTINVTDTYGNIIGTYTFSGWTDPNNGVMGDSDITITGTWTYKGQTIPTHKITYDWGNENIPAGETLPVDENTYVKNQPYEVDKTFTKGYEIKIMDDHNNLVGVYVFSGWDTKDGKMGDEDITIKGSWKYDKINPETFTLDYDANGGKGDMTDSDSPYVKNSEAKVLDNEFTRSNYRFTGWNTKADGTGDSYKAGEVIKMTANMTLYAQWKHKGGGGSGDKKVTLHYESNGGTTYKDERYTYGTTVKLDKTPLREGHTFTGWYADKELTKKISNITMKGDKTVYAGWELTPVPPAFDGDHTAYIIGFVDGTVKPLANITRSEVAAIFYRLLSDEEREKYKTTNNNFADVDPSAWYNTPASTMAAMGIIGGYPDGLFHGTDNITRAEFAAICARFDKNTENTKADFSDISGHWAELDIAIAANNGWIMGYPDGTFRPNQTITRAEAMALINRVLARIPESPQDLLDDMKTWPDNMNTDKWYYIPVQEATNSHDFERKANGSEKWTALNKDAGVMP